MSETIQDEGLITLRPNEERVVNVIWDDALPADVTVTTSAFTITARRPRTATGLSKDSESILSTAPYLSRYTQLRLVADSLGAGLFRVENTVVTSESPVQRKPRWFDVLVQ